MNAVKLAVAACAALTLAACSGSGTRYSSASAVRGPASVQFASGPIYSACLKSDRKQASRARCGCVQAVADQSLVFSDQRRGAGFFSDPHQAQVVRQSDRSSDELFWKRWKEYSDTAAQMCT